MTAESVASSDHEEVPYQHCCFCCTMHVERAVRVLALIYIIVELYAVWDHITDKNPTFPICFVAITSLLVYGIRKKHRTALAVFIALLSIILLVELGMCLWRAPLVLKAFEDEKAQLPANKTSTQAVDGASAHKLLIESVIDFAHLFLRFFVGAYLFKVLLSFREFILEEESRPAEAPAARIDPADPIRYSAVVLRAVEEGPPAYSSTD